MGHGVIGINCRGHCGKQTEHDGYAFRVIFLFVQKIFTCYAFQTLKENYNLIENKGLAMKKYKKVFALMVLTLFCFQGFNAVAMDEPNSEELERQSSIVRKRSHVNTSYTATNFEEDSDESAQGIKINDCLNCLDIFGKITKILLKLAKIYMILSSGEYSS